MRVLCVTEPGQAPSTRLRLGDCLGRYAELGFQVTITSARRSHPIEQLGLVREAARHDAVVLFKTTGFSNLELALLRRANKNIIFDFDDAVMFRELKYRRPLRAKTFKKFVHTLKHCRAAVAGNEFLARLAEACGVRSTVLPTPIDLAKYKLKEQRNGNGLTIGWLGLSDGLGYLKDIQPVLQRLTGMFPGLRLKVVSDKPLQLDGVTIHNEPWQKETEQQNLTSFDIGIMPLWDSLWTRGKCGYKILQYMGVGTAVVASAVGANRDIITHGENGFLAESQDDWMTALGALIENAEQRREFGLRGRKLVEERYSLDRFVNGYATLLRDLTKPLDGTRASH
jgi:glycosyltransferase involved in cell wall biosynthesis